MARIIDFYPEEQQEWCHYCNSLIGYIPGEEQVDYSPWIFSRKYEPYYFKKTDIIKFRCKGIQICWAFLMPRSYFCITLMVFTLKICHVLDLSRHNCMKYNTSSKGY